MSKDDDVMDFINSLPDSHSGTPGPNDSTAGGDDFLEFLDELSAHEKSTPQKGKLGPRKDKKIEPVKNKPVESASSSVTEKAAEVADYLSPQLPAEKSASVELQEKIEEASQMSDPFASLSSWWSSEGSKKASSLWGSLTSNATQLGEQTYQLASNTSQQISHSRQKLLSENPALDNDQVSHITSRLNTILSSVSQQIKDGLMDREDELLNIMLVYDVSNMDYLDKVCASKFNKVMSQVEGGIRVTVSNFNHRHESREGTGPYFDLDIFFGKIIDGEKLCYANLDSSIKDYLKITESEEKAEAADKEKELKEAEEKLMAREGDLDINSSNVFIAIQPISTGSAEKSKEPTERETSATAPVLIDSTNSESFAFALILKDITNKITISTKSQPFPLKWARWVAGDRTEVQEFFGGESTDEAVDPSEWVKEWIQDGLSLSFAVLAQEYVTKRMGI
ncbi:hypothetical protein FT663_00156 [Candidozyma haemuli var. vulneris]|uniref:Maintenance of telomere capping protein 1 n=1 Tax=Candidozyma haemuli TaxID=45357 RepID=A0A2V1AM58_9ASCO|nr:hypothetical protein CXQ85_001052 [[Candida] haemuloni]KAF3994186.1 hypothetical protein FT662_00055 [[Candida] haemuloni var. vulneris]KAF3995734.1 hypothetical protein FT663_00156 [[Candida] haemuloni var. vulneris]PVH18764.1 hypothetical protein CXQ85_001052 [[Candida] haemuloni]